MKSILKTIIALLFLGALEVNAQNASEPPKVAVKISNEKLVNTARLEFSPTFYEDGIVFVSSNNDVTKKKTVDANQTLMMSILRSRRGTNGELQTPEMFSKEITSMNHDGPVCFDRTVETMFYSSNAVVDGKDQFAKDKYQHTRLYMSKKVNGAWSKPELLPFNNNEFDDFHPSISIDGDKLFFASNRPGGFGSYDIYVSYKVGGSWSEPVNLGSEVNTSGREAFPFLHADNTLYFASDRSGGKGGFDLYFSVLNGDKWTKPVSLGDPFNTSSDDFGLIVDLNKINGYFNSNGQISGLGMDDIYSFHVENGNVDDYLLQNSRVPDIDLDFKMLVLDKVSGSPIPGADIQILNYEGGSVIGKDENGNPITVQKVNGDDVISSTPPDKAITGQTDTRGRFGTNMKPGNYVVIINKKDFQTKQYRIPITKTGNELTAQLERTSAAANKVQWTATLFNAETNDRIAGSMVVLTDEKTGKKDTLITDANGVIEHYMTPNTKYAVEVYQGGRLIGTADVDTNGWKPENPVRQNLSVSPIGAGIKLELPNVYYNFNDATLRPDARKDLNMVVAIMKQQPRLMVEIASHTDARGTFTYNDELSQRRAAGVVDYLVSKGINVSRLVAHGYGEMEPRNRCKDGVKCSEQEYARNRRTEIRVTNAASGTPVSGTAAQAPGKPVPTAKPAEAAAETPVNVNTAPASASGDVKNVTERGFYVISGSFKLLNGARSRVEQLRRLGFERARILKFPDSSFYAVAVDQFDTRADADAARDELAKGDLPAFIKIVR